MDILNHMDICSVLKDKVLCVLHAFYIRLLRVLYIELLCVVASSQTLFALVHVGQGLHLVGGARAAQTHRHHDPTVRHPTHLLLVLR